MLLRVDKIVAVDGAQRAEAAAGGAGTGGDDGRRVCAHLLSGRGGCVCWVCRAGGGSSCVTWCGLVQVVYVPAVASTECQTVVAMECDTAHADGGEAVAQLPLGTIGGARAGGKGWVDVIAVLLLVLQLLLLPLLVVCLGVPRWWETMPLAAARVLSDIRLKVLVLLMGFLPSR